MILNGNRWRLSSAREFLRRGKERPRLVPRHRVDISQSRVQYFVRKTDTIAVAFICVSVNLIRQSAAVGMGVTKRLRRIVAGPRRYIELPENIHFRAQITNIHDQ